MKKIVMPLIAFVCGLVIMPKVNAAETHEATTADFVDQISSAQSGDTVVLKAGNNVELSSAITIEKDITIDLGGNTITSSVTGPKDRMFEIKKGNVTIKNGTIKHENTNSKDTLILVYGSDSKVESTYTHLVLDKTLKIEGISAVKVSTTTGKNYGTVVDVAATINTTAQDAVSTAVATHGDLKEGDVVINITGKLTGYDAGIYQAGVSTINVKSGALVTGKSGVVTKAGTLNVTGAKITGTGALVEPAVPSGDGFTPTGAGIQIESNKNYAGNIDVNVNGGSVTSENNSAIQEYLESETEETSVKEISVKGNAALTSAKEKEVVSASESFNETNKEFIEKGTTLSGATNKIASYLKSGLEIDDKGKVVDPEEEKANVTTNDKTDKADKNPATGDGILAFVLLLGLGLMGTVTTAHTLRKSE